MSSNTKEIPSTPSNDANSKPLDKVKSLKNPFLPLPKTKTIRRDPKDIYSPDILKKGLHKPQFYKESPLDKLFFELQQKLEGTIDELTCSKLAKVLLERQQIENVADNDVRYLVIAKLLDYLVQIRDISAKISYDDKNLISISLHDIKTFSKLINVIIVQGIYPALNTFKIGIPLAKRRLNDFSKTKKPIKIESLISNPTAKTYKEKFYYNESLLTLIYDKFKAIFEYQSDVSDLLIRGTGYSDFLTVSITLITCPYFEKSKKSKYLQEFEDFVIRLPSTFELFQTFTLYLSSPSSSFFKQFVVKRLSSLHYDAPKQDGVLTLVEFVLGLRDNEDVNIEKFDKVADIILLKPKDLTTMDYFENIGSQCYDLLVNINRPYVTSCVGHIIERLWIKNKLVVQDFFFKRLWLNLNPDISTKNEDGILTSEKDVNNSINVLISLTKKRLSPELYVFLFKPILVSLWGYFVFLQTNSKSVDVLTNIFIGYFTSIRDFEDIEHNLFGLETIVQNLLFNGYEWEYGFGPNELPQIESQSKTLGDDTDAKINKYLSNLDHSCTAFITFLKNLDDFYILKIFKTLLQRWLKVNQFKPMIENDENPFVVLLELRLIEAIANEFKEDIAETPEEMLGIVDDFLKAQTVARVNPHTSIIAGDLENEEDSDDEQIDEDVNFEALPVLLELLSAILTELPADVSSETHAIMQQILNSLNTLAKTHPDIKSITALGNRLELLLSGDDKLALANSEKNESRVLKRAIASLNDPLVPIRAHGLYLLRQLIQSGSGVIALDFAIELHLLQLKDPEPFIYLNVIKGLESLIDVKGIPVISNLVNLYSGKDGITDVDDRLKIGEVLLRYIQLSNELFTGELAELIVTAALSIVRRHGDAQDDHDIRLRMSAMSLLGVCCKSSILGLLSHFNDILDCAFGILNMELDVNSAVMRRAAVVLLHDFIMATAESSKIPFPSDYRQKTVQTLQYIIETDNDLLTREQAQQVLDDIQELAALGFRALEDQL